MHTQPQPTIRKALVDWLNDYITEYGRDGVVKITTTKIQSETENGAMAYVLSKRDRHSVVRSTVSRVWRELMKGGGFNDRNWRYTIKTDKTDSGRRIWIITRIRHD